MTEDEMVGWNHRFNGHEFEQTLGDGEGPESLACCSPWDLKELDMTERLNNNNKKGKKKLKLFIQKLELKTKSDLVQANLQQEALAKVLC